MGLVTGFAREGFRLLIVSALRLTITQAGSDAGKRAAVASAMRKAFALLDVIAKDPGDSAALVAATARELRHAVHILEASPKIDLPPTKEAAPSDA